MTEIVIRLTVPDGTTVTVEQGNGYTSPPNTTTVPPNTAQQPPQATQSGDLWPTGSCPLHGAEKWKESKFGGYYCTAKDDSQDKGYCTLKSGTVFNGKRIPA
jgi:hypothetical protein